MRVPKSLLVLLSGALLGVTACANDSGGDVRLGPADGRELPASELGRVSVGDTAPDFTLQSLRRGVVALSDFRGEKEVVLVFYRGHW